MTEKYDLHTPVTVPAEWIVRTADGREHPVTGTLVYDGCSEPVIKCRCPGELYWLTQERKTFIAYSNSNNLRGCTLFRCQMLSTRLIGGSDDGNIDADIVGTYIVTNYVHDPKDDKIFKLATLEYECFSVFWREDMISNLHNGIITYSKEERELFRVDFNGYSVSLSQFVATSARHMDYAQAKIITRIHIESKSPASFSEFLPICNDVNRCMYFLNGNSCHYRKMSIHRAVKCSTYEEFLSGKSSAMFYSNELEENLKRKKHSLPVIHFSDEEIYIDAVCRIFSIYFKYKLSIISSISAISNKSDWMYKFFAMCRAVESAYGVENKRTTRDLNSFIEDAVSRLPVDIEPDRRTVIVSRLNSIASKSLSEILTDIDDYIFSCCSFPIELKTRANFNIEGKAKDITSVRNSFTHFSKKIYQASSVDFYDHYLLLKRCFYAYIFLIAGVDSNLVNKNILRHKWLAE